MIPNISFAFCTDSILKWTGTGMGRQTFTTMAHPGFTEVTNSTHHTQSCCILPSVFNDTISQLGHTFLFTTLSTNRKSLYSHAEVTEGSVLLCPFALVTFHHKITWPFYKRSFARSDFFLSLLLFICLFTLSRFLLWHIGDPSICLPMSLKDRVLNSKPLIVYNNCRCQTTLHDTWVYITGNEHGRLPT